MVGVNKTVNESEGSVDVCFMMDKVSELPVSVEIGFTKDVGTSKAPAQGKYHISLTLPPFFPPFPSLSLSLPLSLALPLSPSPSLFFSLPLFSLSLRLSPPLSLSQTQFRIWNMLYIQVELTLTILLET